MQSSITSGAPLQAAQAATWSFPVQDTTPPSAPFNAPDTSLSDDPTAATAQANVDADAGANESSTLSPASVDSDIAHPITPRATPPAVPSKSGKKSRKRKAADPDGDYKTSANKKRTRRAAPTPAKSKSKRRNYDDDAASDYKPTTKIVLQYTVDDDIDNDADICHDDCVDKDEQDMIHCDGEACRLGGKWFHTGCVGFGTILPSNIGEFEWYCPTCREELDVGEDSNGLVARAGGGMGGGGDVEMVSDGLSHL